MTTIEKTLLTVETTVNAPVEKVWTIWTTPEHITNWNFASDDWHSPQAQNDLREGGQFTYRMESKDGSIGFDFTGTYQKIIEHKEISYTLEDGRSVVVLFIANGNQTTVREMFEPESTHPQEMQQQGWQAILNNFKTYVEAPGTLLTIHFQALIDAPVEKVYQTMLDENGYREWTAAFNPSSYYKGSWERGAKILFIGTDKEGSESGMVSRIKENIPNQFVSIEHFGILKNGNEVTEGPEVDGWAGALENYTFTNEGNKTRLSIDMDTNKDFHAYFSATWPKALDKLKELCEA